VFSDDVPFLKKNLAYSINLSVCPCVSHMIHSEAVDGIYGTWYEIHGNVEHPHVYTSISIRNLNTTIIFALQNSEVKGT